MREKKLIFYGILFGVVLGMNGCSGDEKELDWSVGGHDGKPAFTEMARQGEHIAYVPLERRISVPFPEGECPDTVTVQDIILNEDGTAKYGDETTVTETYELGEEWDGEFSIYLGTNRNALLSTDPDTYKKGGVLRGFRILYSLGTGEEREYDLLLRTDAIMGAEGKNGGAYLGAKCGTGIPVLSSVSDVKKGRDGLVVKMHLQNMYDDPWIYQERCTLWRMDGQRNVEIACKDEAVWSDKTHRIKGQREAECSLDIGKSFGLLEPGVYEIYLELVNEKTNENYTVSGMFQFVE